VRLARASKDRTLNDDLPPVTLECDPLRWITEKKYLGFMIYAAPDPGKRYCTKVSLQPEAVRKLTCLFFLCSGVVVVIHNLALRLSFAAFIRLFTSSFCNRPASLIWTTKCSMSKSTGAFDNFLVFPTVPPTLYLLQTWAFGRPISMLTKDPHPPLTSPS